MDATQICKEIAFGSFSNEDLNNIARAIIQARSQIGRAVTRQVSRGAKVSFSNRHGIPVQGVVDSVKIKNVIVNANGTKWRVPANMLTVL